MVYPRFLTLLIRRHNFHEIIMIELGFFHTNFMNSKSPYSEISSDHFISKVEVKLTDLGTVKDT